jgi:hypothetical protein
METIEMQEKRAEIQRLSLLLQQLQVYVGNDDPAEIHLNLNRQ